LSVCPTGCRQLPNPGRGFSSPPNTIKKKKTPTLLPAHKKKNAVWGGFQPPKNLPKPLTYKKKTTHHTKKKKFY
ncbi:hypothetical protein ACVGWW_13065, partial [Enterobacter hormaechei]